MRAADQHHQREDLRVPVVLVRHSERVDPRRHVVRRRRRLLAPRQEDHTQEEAISQVWEYLYLIMKNIKGLEVSSQN